MLCLLCLAVPGYAMLCHAVPMNMSVSKQFYAVAAVNRKASIGEHRQQSLDDHTGLRHQHP